MMSISSVKSKISLTAFLFCVLICCSCSAEEESLINALGERVSFSGAVEVEAYSMDYDSEEDEDVEESDIALATVELGIDADINEYTKGHVLFLWQEDNTEQVEVDEGTITLGGTQDIPYYLSAGKMYVPFGTFNSHFVSDPITLELGETRESAVLVGYVNDYVDFSLGAFNGDIDKNGQENKIESYITSIKGTISSEDVEDFEISLGASYISNIADSNGLEAEMVNGNIDNYIPGFSGFLSINCKNFTFEAEYLGANNEFEIGELSFDNGEDIKPSAWNYELAYAVTEKLEVAGRYEGSKDLWDFQPEQQYGLAASYNLFENTTVALEYLHGRYENKDERDLTTAQLAIEF